MDPERAGRAFHHLLGATRRRCWHLPDAGWPDSRNDGLLNGRTRAGLTVRRLGGSCGLDLRASVVIGWTHSRDVCFSGARRCQGCGMSFGPVNVSESKYFV